MIGKEVLMIYLLVGSCHGLFFNMTENEIRCFVQELPDHMPVIIRFDLNIYNHTEKRFMPYSNGFQLYVDIKDPMNRIERLRYYAPNEDISFTANYEGDYRICISPKTLSSNFFSFRSAKLRVYFDIKVGEKTIDYNKVAYRLSAIQMRIYQLLEQVEQIQRGYNYQRYRDQTLCETSSSTNKHIIKYFLVQSLLILLIKLWRKKVLKFKLPVQWIRFGSSCRSYIRRIIDKHVVNILQT